MNKIKFGKPGVLAKGIAPSVAKVQQNPSPEERTQRLVWNSPARVKARLLRKGFVLAGKRQG